MNGHGAVDQGLSECEDVDDSKSFDLFTIPCILQLGVSWGAEYLEVCSILHHERI